MRNVSVSIPDLPFCQCSDLTKADYSNAYALYNFLLTIVCLPLISVFGVFSNVTNVFLYTRPSLVNSGTLYLAALGVSDFFVVVTGLFIFWTDSARSYLPILKYGPYMIVYALPIGYMAQTCSVYFTVGAAIDCYVAVCWSPMFTSWTTLRRAKIFISLVVCASVLYNSLRFGQFTLSFCLPENTSVSIIEICPTDLFFEVNTVYNVYMYMILMTFLPFLALSILNGLIVGRVRTIAVLAQATIQLQGPLRCSPTPAPGVVERTGPSRDDTITMVMVVVMFLACNTLALIVNIVETFLNPSALLLNFMTDTSNFLVMFNSSINFVIYIIFSKDFRRLFKHYFWSCSCLNSSTRSTNKYALVTLVEMSPRRPGQNGTITTSTFVPSERAYSLENCGGDLEKAREQRIPTVYENLNCVSSPQGDGRRNKTVADYRNCGEDCEKRSPSSATGTTVFFRSDYVDGFESVCNEPFLPDLCFIDSSPKSDFV